MHLLSFVTRARLWNQHHKQDNECVNPPNVSCGFSCFFLPVLSAFLPPLSVSRLPPGCSVPDVSWHLLQFINYLHMFSCPHAFTLHQYLEIHACHCACQYTCVCRKAYAHTRGPLSTPSLMGIWVVFSVWPLRSKLS